MRLLKILITLRILNTFSYYGIFSITAGNHRQVGNDCTVYPYCILIIAQIRIRIIRISGYPDNSDIRIMRIIRISENPDIRIIRI